MILTPRSERSFWTAATAFSLPGIVRDEKTTVSPAANDTLGWALAEIRASAARGSPWLPVHNATTFSRGR